MSRSTNGRPRTPKRAFGAAVVILAALALFWRWSAARSDGDATVRFLRPREWGFGHESVYLHGDGPAGTTSQVPIASVTRLGVVQVWRSLPDPPGPWK